MDKQKVLDELLRRYEAGKIKFEDWLNYTLLVILYC